MAQRKTSSSRPKRSASRSSSSRPAAKAKTTTTRPGAKKTTSRASAGRASAGKRSAGKASAGKKAPTPNMKERMEGLQGWMAEIEKKQSRMTRFGGAAAILAVAASGGALALGIINQQNAATDDDIDELQERVDGLVPALEQQTEKQLKGINTRLDTIEQRIGAVEQKQTQTDSQVQSLQNQPRGGAGAGVC